MKPFQQGDLDGLCGLYSLINAVRLVVHPITDADCHILASQALDMLGERKPISRLFLEGLGYRELAVVCKTIIEPAYPIKRYKPFQHDPAPSLDRYWSRLKSFLDEESRRAVILVTETKHHGHWTTVQAASERRLVLCDSSGMQQLIRKRCTIGAITQARPIMLHPFYTYFFSRK